MSLNLRLFSGSVGASARRAGVCVALLALVSVGARAELPAALDRVPADAMAVIAMPSMERFDRNVSMLITATGMPQLSTPTQMMRMAGFGAGVDMSRSMAVMLAAGHMDADVPPAVMLLPVSDYGAMLAGFGAQGGDGITAFMAAGERMYAKQIAGGYAAISPMRDLLEGFDGAEGNLGAHAIRIGASGAEVASTSDIVVIADSAALSALMGAGMAPDLGMLMGPLGGGLGGLGGVDGMLKSVLDESSAIVLGMRAGSMGMHMDAAAQFKRGTSRYEAFSGKGDSSGLMKRLPGDPFLLAFAMDTSDPRIRTLFAGGEGAAQMAGPAMLAMMDKSDGQAGAVYPNPAGLFGGVLARGVVFYAAKDPAGFAQVYRDSLAEMDGVVANNLQTTTSFNAGAAEVEGVKLDSYSMRVTGAPGMGVPSPMAMFYGPAQGPNGHMARVDGGVYATTTPDTALMGKAIRASKGAGSMGDDKTLRQVADMLPRGRFAEGYLGVKQVMDQAMPFLAMMGQQVNVQIPQDMPPVGAAAVSEGGGMRLSVFVPAPVIKTSVEFGQSMGGMMGAPRGNNGNQRPAF